MVFIGKSCKSIWIFALPGFVNQVLFSFLNQRKTWKTHHFKILCLRVSPGMTCHSQRGQTKRGVAKLTWQLTHHLSFFRYKAPACSHGIYIYIYTYIYIYIYIYHTYIYIYTYIYIFLYGSKLVFFLSVLDFLFLICCSVRSPCNLQHFGAGRELQHFGVRSSNLSFSVVFATFWCSFFSSWYFATMVHLRFVYRFVLGFI